jgi:hypothetical protein
VPAGAATAGAAGRAARWGSEHRSPWAPPSPGSPWSGRRWTVGHGPGRGTPPPRTGGTAGPCSPSLGRRRPPRPHPPRRPGAVRTAPRPPAPRARRGRPSGPSRAPRGARRSLAAPPRDRRPLRRRRPRRDRRNHPPEPRRTPRRDRTLRRCRPCPFRGSPSRPCSSPASTRRPRTANAPPGWCRTGRPGSCLGTSRPRDRSRPRPWWSPSTCTPPATGRADLETVRSEFLLPAGAAEQRDRAHRNRRSGQPLGGLLSPSVLDGIGGRP